MYFRFIAALLLVVVISMAGVVLEKHTVDMRRAVSRQYYQTDLLLDLQVKLRLETQRLTAPSQLEQLTTPGVGVAQQRSPEVDGSESPERTESRSPLLPLLRFRHPFRPEGID
ncbi:MAG: hypothetical protein KDA85_12955 [Planctomycetaceae bacterium]|nr:hypothetical protein [Planctomycetaceae bacterium]